MVICGFSRSGTSILYTLLSNAIKKVKFYDDEISALNLGNDHELCLTKRPLDCFKIDEILSKFKKDDVRIIFCIRDPRDLVCSTHKSVPHDYFIGYQNSYFIDSKKNVTTLTNPGIRQTAIEWLKHKEKSNVFTLKYEKLVNETDSTLINLINFLEVSLDPNHFKINKNTRVPKGVESALNGVRKLDTDSVGIWKKHPIRVWNEFTLNKELHEINKSLGYEQNPKWFFEHFSGKLPIALK